MIVPTARMTGTMVLIATPTERIVRLVTDVSHHEALTRALARALTGALARALARGGTAGMPP
jgi:hypothetical protein